MKTSYLTPAHAWARICKAIAAYGGGPFEWDLYKRLKENQGCINAVDALQKRGVEFTANAAFHWSFDLMGSFEVTHRSYKSPEGSTGEEAGVLYEFVYLVLNGETIAETEAKRIAELAEKRKKIISIQYSCDALYALARQYAENVGLAKDPKSEQVWTAAARYFQGEAAKMAEQAFNEVQDFNFLSSLYP